MMFNQRKFIADYNASHRDDFNEFFFNRSEDDIINELEKVILSAQRNKFFTIKVNHFRVIDDYREIYNLLYEAEKKRRNKRGKRGRF